jgi:hypothetical protein
MLTDERTQLRAVAGDPYAYGVRRPVNRVNARCTACDETKDNVFEPVAEAWAREHAARHADPRGVELTITYHEIGLTSDHFAYFRRWADDIRADFRKNVRRRDFYRCAGEVSL